MHFGENLSSLALGIRVSQVRDCFSCMSQVLGRFKIVQISPDCIDWSRLYRLVVLRLSRLVVFRLSSAKSSGPATRSFPQIAAIRLASWLAGQPSSLLPNKPQLPQIASSIHWFLETSKSMVAIALYPHPHPQLQLVP